jgi:hypothetical protein
MTIYTACPVQKTARGVWGYFCKKHGQAPKRLWKMPQCFKKEVSVEAGGWGMWIAEYDGYRDFYDPAKPEQKPISNVYSFLKKQTILERILK